MAFRISYTDRLPEVTRWLKERFEKGILDHPATELYEVMTGIDKTWIRKRDVDKMFEILDMMGWTIEAIALTPEGYFFRGVKPKISVGDVQERLEGFERRRTVAKPKVAEPVKAEIMEKIRALCEEVI